MLDRVLGHRGAGLSRLFGVLHRRHGDDSRLAGDEPRCPLVRQVAPGPLEHDDDAIAKSDEKQNVNEQPRQPGDESRDMDFAKLRDAGGAADGS